MADGGELLELRFEHEAADCFEDSIKSLGTLDLERGEVARDPTIVAALTIVGAAVSLAIELVKLARELKARGKRRGVLVVKLDNNNEEKTLSLLEATDDDINAFVSEDPQC